MARLRARLTRRAFLGRSGVGLGSVALGALLEPARLWAAPPPDAPWAGVVRPLHLPARTKRVIHLYQAGGPSHLELFDNKPKLAAMNGEPMPESFTKGQPIAQLQNQKLKCFGPQHPFTRYGQSGQEITTLLPEIGGIADDICIVRSMQTEQINHDPAHTFMNTGTQISGRPAAGSWIWYGIGAEATDLPGFVVLISQGRGGQMQPIAARQWNSGFLPSRFQGVQFRSKGDAVLYLRDPEGTTHGQQRDVIDAVAALTRSQPDWVDDPEVTARLSQYEMAFKMQTSVPALTDFSSEPAHVREMYGASSLDGSFAANCLLARRMAERGVRYIQLYHRDWDHHSRLKGDIVMKAREVDRASAALVKDLKQRGMLDETLVIWGGEFGRTPMAQGDGRDHHIKGFSLWMAGGGIKGGITHGATDDLGYMAVDDVVSVHDLHATMLHLMGIDHTRLTFKFLGRDFRLTDVHGSVVQKILA
ncbi:MAG TPA: DUF1501 domain-containing protein [Vicinamibacteria bacterium]|nr:DUF1501 domain-containing protein [Vicinamibacteria bacterium]